MEYFFYSLILANLIIIVFNSLRFIRTLFILRNNFKKDNDRLISFLKEPRSVYNEATYKMDQLQETLISLIDTIHDGEELILEINQVHKEINNKFESLDSKSLLDEDMVFRYNELNSVFNMLFDRSQENINLAYQLMDTASSYLKRG